MRAHFGCVNAYHITKLIVIIFYFDFSLPAAALAAAPIFNEFLTIVRSGAPYYC